LDDVLESTRRREESDRRARPVGGTLFSCRTPRAKIPEQEFEISEFGEGRFMGVTLHTWHMASEAVAAFGGNGASEAFCERQFVVLPSIVLCFVTTGQTFDESHVSSPSQVTWRPKLGTVRAHPDDSDWLPETVREIYDRNGPQVRKLRTHHVLVRSPADERFFYAGEAHLGSYGSTSTTSGEWGLGAHFSLSQKLPRDVWLKLGGYPGWLVEVNHEPHCVEAGDLAEFERLVNELPLAEFSHLCMTRYEEDSLTLHTNTRRGWLMYLRDPADSGVYARDLEYDGAPGAEEVLQCACGIDLEFEAARTLPHESAQRAAVEFFQTGRLPECVHWESE